MEGDGEEAEIVGSSGEKQGNGVHPRDMSKKQRRQEKEKRRKAKKIEKRIIGQGQSSRSKGSKKEKKKSARGV